MVVNMIKFRLYYDKDKETKWLNEMAAEGWGLIGFFMGFYRFSPCEPGKYLYQIDYTSGMFSVSDDYREFMKEADVDIVCLWGPWVVLRREAVEGPFELYTDVESTIEHYTKIQNMFKVVVVIELPCLFIELIGAFRGSTTALGGLFLVMAIILALLREILRINQMLTELKSRQGEAVGFGWFGKRRVDLAIPIGMILNSVGFLIESFGVPYLRCFLTAIASACILIGVIQTVREQQ